MVHGRSGVDRSRTEPSTADRLARVIDESVDFDADAGLHRPNEIAKDAAVVLADWPDASDE